MTCDTEPVPCGIRVELVGGVTLLRVVGELDLSTQDALTESLREAVALPSELIVVDLAACEFIDRRTFQAIEEAARTLHGRGAQLAVRSPPPSFRIISAHAGGCRAFVIPRPPGPGGGEAHG